ncbi:MAG: cytochrome c nitrite reductase small subunit [Ignavibacteriales bacterium]|nr:cytochrome c nitrite reductase small subunit [Ignavibacteriales bacterium]
MVKKTNLFVKIYNFFKPPKQWKLPSIIVSGIICGLLFFNFYISNAISYMSDEPEACINCHIMIPHYATWERGSHGRVTNCNDCHVPQDNIFRKYFFKAYDGLQHATIFTLKNEEHSIRIKDLSKSVVQENCIRCHENNIHPIALRSLTAKSIVGDGEDRFCWECHREVPHGRVRSETSTPFARIPK